MVQDIFINFKYKTKKKSLNSNAINKSSNKENYLFNETNKMLPRLKEKEIDFHNEQKETIKNMKSVNQKSGLFKQTNSNGLKIYNHFKRN